VQITVQELAALLGGQSISGDCAIQVVKGATSIAEAAPGDVTFFGNPKYLQALKGCRATAALVPMDFAEEIAPVAIRVENPSLAFAQLLEKFAPPTLEWAPGVHATAVVDPGAQLAEGVSVQPYAVIEAGAKIGAFSVIGAHSYVGHGAQVGSHCFLASHVSVGARCIVGNRVILHSGVVLGSDGFGFEFSQGRHVKIPQTGIVQLDDDVEVGANSTIDRARFGRTWIGEGTKIDNLVQIAHNVVTGKHCLIIAQTGIAGSSKLGNYVTLAGQSAVVGHVEIGDQVIAGARSGISKDIEAKQVVWGAPAIPIREAKEQAASLRRLPKLLQRVKQLELSLAEVQKSLLPES
jgi:UDP-3-O-[3-hydroxymyristoyl] glucosamine N-acyltransferase